jgi:hypothetical protein
VTGNPVAVKAIRNQATPKGRTVQSRRPLEPQRRSARRGRAGHPPRRGGRTGHREAPAALRDGGRFAGHAECCHGRGYQVTACADQVELEQAGGAVLAPIGRAQSTTLRPGTRHKLGVTVAGEHAAVTIDGPLVLQAALGAPDLASGQILLGVTNSGSTGSAEARFTDLDVRTG